MALPGCDDLLYSAAVNPCFDWSDTMYLMKRTCLLAIAIGLVLAGCRGPKPSSTDAIAAQIRAGNEGALRDAERLANPEDQVALIPALTDAYNSGYFPDDILELLVSVGHPDGIPVFDSALESDDNRMAGLAARGLAVVGSETHSGAVANRLRRVRDPNQYEPFLDALRQMPGGDPSVAPIISEIILRPAGSIGGISTVRFGCTAIGRSGATDEDTVKALLFGFVNMDGAQNATNECALALLNVGDPAIPYLLEVLNHENEVIAGHLVGAGYTAEVAGLRAARVLADMASPAAFEGLNTWFTTLHLVPIDQIASMDIQQAMNWHQNFGQQFIFASEALEYLASPEPDDPAHLLLRGLIVREEGQPLFNFTQFMNTGTDAELGLRSAAMDALANVGDPADRDLVYAIAQSGTLADPDIPDKFIRKHAAYTFAMLSQAGDLERFDALLDAATPEDLVADLQIYRPMIELVADGCHHELDCLTGLLSHENNWVRTKAAFDLAHYTENQTAAAAALLEALGSVQLDMRFTFVRQLRQMELPQTAGERIDQLLSEAEGSRFRDYRYHLRVLRKQKID